jgi:PAT family beta-lactamase induction signal transducer AmpG
VIDHVATMTRQGTEETSFAMTPSAEPPRSKRTLWWTSSTYFGEGLPWSFLHQMATEYLTAIGATKTQISSTSLFHLAVTFKFAWSPVIDLLGNKRTWVIATQVVLAGGMMVVAALSSGPSLTPFWMATALFAIVHATHDIACDGFYLQALDRRDQALYSGVRTAAYRAAMIAGASVLVVLAGQTSWPLGFGAAGALMLLTALVNAWCMPRPDDAHAALVARPATAFWTAYRSFFAQPQAALVLSFMLFYKLGDIMMFAMSKPLLRDLGVDTSHRGILNGIGTASYIVGSMLGGALVARRGLARTLVPLIYTQNLAIPLYVAMAVAKPGLWGIGAIVLVEQFVSGLGSSAHIVFLMQRSRATFSASHYALATAVVSLGSTFSGYASGPLNEKLGHPLFFSIAFLASVPSLIMALFVPKAPLEPEVTQP